MTNEYDRGDLVRCSGVFTNITGAAIDPSVVNISVKTPEGVISTRTFGTHAEVIKVSTGSYHLDVDANESGTWYFRWHSTGVGQSAAESAFIVKRSQFV